MLFMSSFSAGSAIFELTLRRLSLEAQGIEFSFKGKSMKRRDERNQHSVVDADGAHCNRVKPENK